jgi:hypothetical protein
LPNKWHQFFFINKAANEATFFNDVILRVIVEKKAFFLFNILPIMSVDEAGLPDLPDFSGF